MKEPEEDDIEEEELEDEQDEHPFGPDYNSRGQDFNELDRLDGMR